ncbi:ion transporter [Salinisphaera sp. P385]|uniref:Ion transporter n=1 Tax=Spectribacter acetivorans TaxID=3075603 RepID=A0ABU3BAX5_9GAMM|nr:ion transporter [Salinisphaera sp. P385]MDT0618121.1 ion transporter [Salinisphaera sp. P385]
MSRAPVIRPSGRGTLAWAGLAWDLTVLALVAINLGLILFDSLFVIETFAAGVAWLSPAVHDWYAATVHEHFATIDLYFVAIFIADVLIGWGLAIWYQRYHRWFFYPFVHWYDVLGCIPLAGFRWLRVLRVLALGIRLQRLGLIDVRQWRAYAFAKKYYDILVEEVSDRVVVNVLDGIQEEVRSGGKDLTTRVLQEIIQPRRQQLVNVISQRIEAAVTKAYGDNRDEIQGYVSKLVNRAVSDNVAIAGVERVPMLGAAVTRSLEWAIRDAVNSVLDEAVTGLESDEFDDMVQHIADSVLAQLLETQASVSPDINEAIVEVVELLKEQVRVQRWKETYA